MNRTILVVDDDPSVLEVTELILQTEGYSVIRAIDGEDAIEKAREHQPDAIILDIILPKLSGYMVASLLSKDEKLKNIPILLLTGTSVMAGGISLELPSKYRVTKPFRPEDLLDTLEQMFEGI